MKKIRILSLTILPIIASTAIFTSCHKNKSHFIDIPEKDKQKEAEQGLDYAAYEVPLVNTIGQWEHLEATATTTGSSIQGLSVDISYISISAEDPKWLWFVADMDGIPSNVDTYWATFDVAFTCKNIEGNVVWTDSIKGFKLTVTHDPQPTVETHTVATTQGVNNLAIATNKSSIVDDDEFTITLTNNRGKAISDATITIVSGTSVVTENIGEIVTVGSWTKTYTRTEINNMFTAAGQAKLVNGAEIKFIVVRDGSYRVTNDFKLEVCDKYASWSSVSDTGITQLAGKFLIKDKTNNDFEFSGEKDFTTYFRSLPNGSESDLYLISGSYFIGEGSLNPPPAHDVELHGLKNSIGTKTATMIVHRKDGVNEYLNAKDYRFNLIQNLNMECNTPTAKNEFASYGMHCPVLNCVDCDFKGVFTLYTLNPTFTGCTFDSSESTFGPQTQLETEYGMFIYTPSDLTFDKCTFTGCGKCAKIYPLANQSTFTFNFNKCTFDLNQHSYENPPAVKSPINIDIHLVTQPGKYTFKIHQCVQTASYLAKQLPIYDTIDPNSVGVYEVD